MTAQRMVKTAAATAALSVMAIGSAQAATWTWATSDNPLLMSGGKGYGNLYDAKLQEVGLRSTLADTKTGDGRVFARGVGTGTVGSVEVQSGRRSDGQSSYAAMATATAYTGYGVTVHQYTRWAVNLCRDVTGFDPCSDAQRVYNGRL